MPLTFAQLRTEILGWLDESAASTSSSSYLNAGYALKQAHTIRLTEDNWRFMIWPRQESLTTVSGQQLYSLHQEFLRPLSFRNSTQGIWLTETPARNIEKSGVDWDTDQDTGRFTLWGRSQVQNQPSSASTLAISSSSASDTGSANAVIITGDTTAGMVTESVTPTGVTPVATTHTFTQIISVTKAAAWTGTLTITSNSAAVTNLTLFSGEYGRSFPQLQLMYLPTGGETVKYRFYRKPSEFGTNDNDISDIPPPFERVLIFDALLMMGAYDGRLDPGRMSVWAKMRDDLDFQMRQTEIEGQSLGAEGRYIMERSNLTFVRMP